MPGQHHLPLTRPEDRAWRSGKRLSHEGKLAIPSPKCSLPRLGATNSRLPLPRLSGAAARELARGAGVGWGRVTRRNGPGHGCLGFRPRGATAETQGLVLISPQRIPNPLQSIHLDPWPRRLRRVGREAQSDGDRPTPGPASPEKEGRYYRIPGVQRGQKGSPSSPIAQSGGPEDRGSRSWERE